MTHKRLFRDVALALALKLAALVALYVLVVAPARQPHVTPAAMADLFAGRPPAATR